MRINPRIHSTVLAVIVLAFGLTACNSPNNSPAATDTAVIAAITAPPTATATAVPTLISPPTPTPSPEAPLILGSYEDLSPSAMRADLDELFHRLETTHPNLYAQLSPAEAAAARQRLADELSQPMSILSYYEKVAELVSAFGDYHLDVGLPPETQAVLAANELFFPLWVEFQDGQAFVTMNLADVPGVPVGTELLAINGTAVADIQARLPRLHAYGTNFSPGLWFLFGSVAEYQVEARLPGAETAVILPIPGVAMQQLMVPPPETVVYATLPGEKIGLLTVNNFVDDLAPGLKSAFTQIQADGVEHLIIDVRANPGGTYVQVDALMRYLTDQPYRHCSQSFTAPSPGATAVPTMVACDERRPFTTPLLFQGDLYLLIGSNSFSNAAIFAAILQDYDLAVLIGEETATLASCGSVFSPTILPKTKLPYFCPTTCFIRPNGVQGTHGVIPDHLVETALQDRFAGRDPVLDYTLDLIRRADTTP